MTPGTCQQCGSGDLDLKWPVPFESVPSMVINGEWLALEPMPIVIICQTCEFELFGEAQQLTIDVDKGVILHAFIRPYEVET